MILYIPKRIINRVAWKLRLPIQFLLSSDMHPLNLWLLSNKKLKEFLEQYYRKNIDRIEDPGLREDVRKTFEKGYGYDKICAINLLGVFKRYF